MDEYQRIESEFAFLEGDKRILAVLLFGSGAKGQADSRRVTVISVLLHLT